jgi:glycosyltransferase involved in cell wall biosynthesis
VIVFVNYVFGYGERDAYTFVSRDSTVAAWPEAVHQAGGEEVAVVQRFRCDCAFARGGVQYRFVASDRDKAEPAPWYLGGRVVRAVRALRPDVVHVDGMVYPLHVRLLRAALPRRVPVLVQDHGGVHRGSPGFRRAAWRSLFRAGLRAADGFLFSSPEQAAPWQEAGIVGADQPIYGVMESSTDLHTVAPRPGDRRAAGRPALLWVGRLDDNKDPLTILRAFERARPRLPQAELTMAFGTDTLLPAVKRLLASSSALAGRVHLLGRVERQALPALYASADLFVLGSHHESSGYALIEALAFGVTPIVSDIPSYRVLTGGGAIGALFPVGDVDALAAALVRLSSSAPGARAAVRDHFTRRLSWAAVGREASAIYTRAAARARHHHRRAG